MFVTREEKEKFLRYVNANINYLIINNPGSFTTELRLSAKISCDIFFENIIITKVCIYIKMHISCEIVI